MRPVSELDCSTIATQDRTADITSGQARAADIQSARSTLAEFLHRLQSIGLQPLRSSEAGLKRDLVALRRETEFYAQHGVRAEFVGHPLADQIPLEIDRDGARRALGLAPGARVITPRDQSLHPSEPVQPLTVGHRPGERCPVH